MESDSQQSVRTQTETEAFSPDEATGAASTRSSAPAQRSMPADSASILPSRAAEETEVRPGPILGAPLAAPAAHAGAGSAEIAGAGALSDDAPLLPAESADGVIDHNEQTQLDLPNPAPAAVWSAPAGTAAEGLEQRVSPVSPMSPYPGAAPVSPRMPGQTPGNVPWEAASSWGATTLTISANTAAGASYLFWWVSGMLIYFNERHNRFVRFHAMQSILLTGAMTVFGVLAYILSSLCGDIYQATGLHAYSTLGTFIAATAIILIVFVWLWAMIAAWSGNYMRLPIVGTYAERYSAPPLHPPSVF